LVPVLFTFYIHDVLKLKKNHSGAKMLISFYQNIFEESRLCGRLLADIADLSPFGHVNFSADDCVLSGRGIYLEPITRPEESYRVWRAGV